MNILSACMKYQIPNKFDFFGYCTYSIYPAVVCKTPFGVPVEPEVYNINNGSSASIHSHSPTKHRHYLSYSNPFIVIALVFQ